MSRLNKDMIHKAADRAPLEEAKVIDTEIITPVEEEIQKQTPIYGIPKSWAKLVKKHRHATFSTYARAAIEEKMKRDGLL